MTLADGVDSATLGQRAMQFANTTEGVRHVVDKLPSRRPGRRSADPVALRRAGMAVLVAWVVLLAACATLPPGMGAPKAESQALADPESTTLGKSFSARAAVHPGLTGLHLMTDGAASFALHLAIAARAERTLDAQYFIFRQDDTGQLLLHVLLEAADRGVRVRLLIDDAEAFDSGSMLRPLAAHPNIQIRIFNPFVVRRELALFRWAEFIVGGKRLNYRMHNKLFLGDNAIAITGGRNVGDPYFQASAARNLADIDLAVAGPMVAALSRSFDLYWNDRLAIPVETLPLGKPSEGELAACREALAAHGQRMATSEYVIALPGGDYVADLLSPSGDRSLVWAEASLAYDPPDKAQAGRDGEWGRLLWPRVAKAVESAREEVIIVSPYLVPGESEMALIRRLSERGVRIRILTNSLASTDMPIAHAGYMHYRVPLLDASSEIHELRPVPAEPEAHGLIKSGGSGQFGLHAKAIIIDRERVFVGSMNFDQRSLEFNTELGLIIRSPELASTIAARFEAIAQPANSYRVAKVERFDAGVALEWVTEEEGAIVRFDSEPEVSPGKHMLIQVFSLLPLDRLL